MSHITAAPRLAARPRAAHELFARLLGALRDWRLPLLAALCALGLLLAAQAPLRFSFSVGHDGGPQTDRPFLQGFRPAELTSLDNRWRWSFPEASVVVPGVGARPLVVSFRVVAHRQDFQPDAPPTVLTVASGAGAPVPLTLQRGLPRRYQLYVPAQAVAGGTLRLGLSTERWQNAGDERAELGVAIGGPLTLDEAGGRRPILPGAEILSLTLATALLWLACRAADIRPNTALWGLLALLAVTVLLALLTPPRLASSARWALEAALIALGAAAAGALLIPPLLARWRIPVTPRALRWLVLLVAVSFTIKYGGQFHPVAMRGDLQLHVHRFSRTVSGEVYIPAQHRGLPFPFPSGWYAGIAPLTLTGAPVRDLFEITAGLFEATAVVLVYIMLARVTGSAAGGLLGALIYTVSPVWMLNVWWAFHTQVASQWFLLALMTLLVVRWPDYDDPLVWGWAVALLVLVSLSHIGSFLNLGAAAVVALPWLWLRARSPAERRAARLLLWAGVAAGLFVVLFYYSAFAGKIATQITGIAAEGMVGVTEKPPVPRDVLLRSLWQDGLIEHYGFFIVALGVAGAALASLWPRERAGALPPLLWATFIVVFLQAMLPLATQSSVTTRYLTFAGWAFTAGATVAGLALWRRGPAGRVALTAMLAYAAWVSAEIWIGAMALNAWPAEPF
jgi:hypothetical protein